MRLCNALCVQRVTRLGSLATDAAGQLDVLGHDGHALGVDRAQVGILEETDKVGLRGFLQRKDSGALESQVRLEILRDLADEVLERKIADEQVRAFLVSADLTKSNGTGTVAVGLFDTASRRGGFAGCLGGELLTGRFASGRLTGGLLCTGHDRLESCKEQIQECQHEKRKHTEEIVPTG